MAPSEQPQLTTRANTMAQSLIAAVRHVFPVGQFNHRTIRGRRRRRICRIRLQPGCGRLPARRCRILQRRIPSCYDSSLLRLPGNNNKLQPSKKTPNN